MTNQTDAEEIIFKEIKDTYIHKLTLLEYEKLVRWINKMSEAGRQSAQKEYHDAKVMASKEELDFLKTMKISQGYENWEKIEKGKSKLKSATTKMNSNTSSNDDE